MDVATKCLCLLELGSSGRQLWEEWIQDWWFLLSHTSRETVPSSPYTSPTTWNSKQRLWTGGGDKSRPTGKTSFANLQISCICLWVDGSQQRVIAGKELHNSGGPRPRLLPATPTPTWTFAEKILDMVTIVWLNKNNGNELCCNSSTVKDDVSALLWVFWVPPKQSAHLHGTGRESDIKLYLHSKIQNYLSAMILCCVKF